MLAVSKWIQSFVAWRLQAQHACHTMHTHSGPYGVSCSVKQQTVLLSCRVASACACQIEAAVIIWLVCLARVTLISTTFKLLSILLQTQTALSRSLLIQTDLSRKAQGSLCCLIRVRLVRHPTGLQRASALLQVHYITRHCRCWLDQH